jgi:hypothetical protein
VVPDVKLVLVGETLMVTLEVGGAMATTALAFFVESATLVAVTVTLVLLVTVGAVNRPLDETVPALELQVTAVLVEPLTAALNCREPAEATLALPGEIVTLIMEPEPEPATVICG